MSRPVVVVVSPRQLRRRFVCLTLVSFLSLLLLFAHRVDLWRLCRHVLKTTDAQSRDPNLGLLAGLAPSTPPEAFDLFKLGPFRFLDNFRNPCWFTSATGQLACLPFFFLAGFPKCGTTELYVKLHKHQHVAKLIRKEPHWLTRQRYQNESFDNYTWFIAKSLMRKTWRSSPSQHLSYNPYIVGDGSASTVWDNDRWYMLPDSSHYSEPFVTHADYVRHLLPAAKFIIILRNPTLRIYSDYNFFFTNGSIFEFHELAVKQIDILKNCFAQHTVRFCVYNQSLNSVFRIRLGLYHVFLEDWFQRFPRDQIHVLRLEDLAVNVTRELLPIYRFLGLADPSKQTIAAITQKARPRRKGVRSLALGPMLMMTKATLDEFYRPFNVRVTIVSGLECPNPPLRLDEQVTRFTAIQQDGDDYREGYVQPEYGDNFCCSIFCPVWILLL